MIRLPSTTIVIIKVFLLAVVQIVLFIYLYESGFNLIHWLKPNSAKTVIGYGLTLRAGIVLFSIMALVNGFLGVVLKTRKSEIISLLACLSILAIWFIPVAADWPYKFSLIMLSAAIPLLLPSLINTLLKKTKSR